MTQYLGQIVPIAPNPALNSVWQWTDGGNPVYEDPNQEWVRYLPTSTRSDLAPRPGGQQFINGMESNQQHFTVNFGTQQVDRLNKRNLLRVILAADVKKIRVENGAHGTGSIIISKYNDALHPMHEWKPLSSANAINDLILKINENAREGWVGPGTYPCRYHSCLIGLLMTQSIQVKWGPEPHQVVNCRQHFTCSCNNVVYLLHCDACLQLGLWTTYVGTTHKTAKDFHARCTSHIAQLQHSHIRRSIGEVDDLFPDLVNDMLRGVEPDPNQLLRDPFVHFNHIHTRQDRRYTILGGGFATKEERLAFESFHIAMFGNYQYDPITNSGNLNHFA